MSSSNGPRTTAEDADITGDGSFDHGFTSRFNAWFFTAFDRIFNRMAAIHKDAAFGEIVAPVVVELGAGTGANLGRLRAGTTLHAIEPNRRMHRKLQDRAAAAHVNLHVQPSGAERIDLPDASVDEVICSLVLCSVSDLDAVVREVHRVLRPGGRFRFVEHVAATGLRGAVQRALRRPWGWLFEGCDPYRDPATAIRATGFAEVTVVDRKFQRSPFWPVNTAVWGIATR